MLLLAESDALTNWTAAGSLATLALVASGFAIWAIDRLWFSGQWAARIEMSLEAIRREIEHTTRDIRRLETRADNHEQRIGRLENRAPGREET